MKRFICFYYSEPKGDYDACVVETEIRSRVRPFLMDKFRLDSDDIIGMVRCDLPHAMVQVVGQSWIYSRNLTTYKEYEHEYKQKVAS